MFNSAKTVFLPPIPDKLHALAIAGVQGRYAIDVPGAFINRVGGAALHAENVQQTIAAVQAYCNPDVLIIRAAPNDRRHIAQIYQVGFQMAASAADLFADMMIDTPTMTHYLVYLEDVPEPVGAASMFYIEEYGAVVLEASVILEPYRGLGIYKSMIARRIHDAQADGMQVTVFALSRYVRNAMCGGSGSGAGGARRTRLV